MGRAPCCDDKAGLKKGAWTAEEDEKLTSFIQRNNGHGSWRTLPKEAGLQRCGKSCRLRWTNYLRPNIKRGNFSPEEERLITHLHALVGNRWSNIASHLPGRTDNEVKNHWNTHLKKRLSKMGIDPATHLPIASFEQSCYNPHNYNNNWSGVIRAVLDPSIISHMTQWELARMEAEARLAARGREHASYSSWSGIRLIDFLITRQNCTPPDEISVPAQRAAQHRSCVTLQNWEDALRMNQTATTALSTQEVAAINGTDGWDLDLDCMIACSPSGSDLSSGHDFFQSFQGGDVAHPLEPSALSSGTAVTMPAHDYGNYSLSSSQNISVPHESSNVSLRSDLLTPANGVISDYPLALSNSTQSCGDDNQENWANMLDLVGPFMPCQLLNVCNL